MSDSLRKNISYLLIILVLFSNTGISRQSHWCACTQQLFSAYLLPLKADCCSKDKPQHPIPSVLHTRTSSKASCCSKTKSSQVKVNCSKHQFTKKSCCSTSTQTVKAVFNVDIVNEISLIKAYLDLSGPIIKAISRGVYYRMTSLSLTDFYAQQSNKAPPYILYGKLLLVQIQSFLC